MVGSSSHPAPVTPITNGAIYDEPSSSAVFDDTAPEVQPEQQRKKRAYSAELFKWTKQQWEGVRGEIARAGSNSSTTSSNSTSSTTDAPQPLSARTSSSDDTCPFRESALEKMPPGVAH